MDPTKRKTFYIVIAILFIATILFFLSGKFLITTGEFLVMDEEPLRSDAVVVLNSGVELFPRLIEAGALYKMGLARKVIVNGNRKTNILRELEKKGFKSCCPWYEDSIRILFLMGVPREDVLAVSAEDAYDTVSEAEIVGEVILQKGFSCIIIATSKYHTRRARFIWSKMYGERLTIYSVSAKTDPYDSKGWWKEGRQIRWVLAEYGGWVYDWWKMLRD